MIVNGWKLLTIITKSSTLDVVAVLDPTLVELIQNYQKQKKACRSFKPCQIDSGNFVSYKIVSNNWLWIFFVVWPTEEKRKVWFSAETIVRDSHHGKSPTHWEHDLNLRRIKFQALLNEVV